jgi:hypothetical protein
MYRKALVDDPENPVLLENLSGALRMQGKGERKGQMSVPSDRQVTRWRGGHQVLLQEDISARQRTGRKAERPPAGAP